MEDMPFTFFIGNLGFIITILLGFSYFFGRIINSSIVIDKDKTKDIFDGVRCILLPFVLIPAIIIQYLYFSLPSTSGIFGISVFEFLLLMLFVQYVLLAFYQDESLKVEKNKIYFKCNYFSFTIYILLISNL